jgi:hypothetical protein
MSPPPRSPTLPDQPPLDERRLIRNALDRRKSFYERKLATPEGGSEMQMVHRKSPLPIGLAGCKAEGLNMRRLRQRRVQMSRAPAAAPVHDEASR